MLPLWDAPFASQPVHATVAIPGSKSLTNRELMLSALAQTPSTITGGLRSRDTDLMVEALEALGTKINLESESWTITPASSMPGKVADIDVGLAGTVMRFVPFVAALRAGTTRFDGDEAARVRPMDQIIAALEQLGVTVSSCEGRLPVEISSDGDLAGGAIDIDASASSQFVSALLLAGSRFRQGLRLRHVGEVLPSRPHIDMTIACLQARGITVDTSVSNQWSLGPGPILGKAVTIEPDLSNAAPFLMLALTSNGTITVPHWPQSTTQAGDALREILPRMGAEVELSGTGLTVRGTGTIAGIDVDLHDVGELTPTVAALCALADSPSRLRGIGHIRGHETDRLKALRTELSNIGATVEEHPDGLSIVPGARRASVWRTYADHRMAHAGVIIASAIEGVQVEDIATTSKTYPDFAADWMGLFTS